MCFARDFRQFSVPRILCSFTELLIAKIFVLDKCRITSALSSTKAGLHGADSHCRCMGRKSTYHRILNPLREICLSLLHWRQRIAPHLALRKLNVILLDNSWVSQEERAKKRDHLVLRTSM